MAFDDATIFLQSQIILIRGKQDEEAGCYQSYKSRVSYDLKAIQDRCPADHEKELPCTTCGAAVRSFNHKWRSERPLKVQTILKRLGEVQDREALVETIHRVATNGYTKLLRELISVCPHTERGKLDGGGCRCLICQTDLPISYQSEGPKAPNVGL